MKNQIAFVVSIIFCFNCQSQQHVVNSTEEISDNNIYRYSTQKFFANLESALLSYKSTDSNTFNEANDFFQEIYILKSDFVNNSLDTTISKRLIFVDNEREFKGILKDKGNQKLLKVIPLRINKDVFFVNILLFEAGIDNNELLMANISGTSIKFKYDCDLNAFIFLEGEEIK